MNDAAIGQIIDRLADESWRRRNSAILYFLIGAIFQAGIVLLLYKAQSFASAGAGEKIGFFVFASFFVVWLPVAASVYYLRGSRKSAMRPKNILYRALTREPQLIVRIEREPAEIAKPAVVTPPSSGRGANVAGAIVEGILDAALSAACGASSDNNSNDYYDANDGESSPNAPRAPRVFVCLTNGETREILSPLDAAQTVAALQKHAPRAVVAETKK